MPTNPVCPVVSPAPGTGTAHKTAGFYKAFPEVSWFVCATDMGLKGLWVGPVWIKRTPASPWMMVLGQAGPAEIFVPYHIGEFRPYDLQWTQYLDQVTVQDAGSNGWIHTLSNDSEPTVVTEIRSRGIGWLCKGGTGRGPSPMMVRRGEDFVLWGVVDGGNYDNIIEYGFRDDGGMTFRMGNTGFNSPSYVADAHTHIALWYVDMDLNGPADDTAYWYEHEEPSQASMPERAWDYMQDVQVEAARRWTAERYPSLLILDTALNEYGIPMGYVFTPDEDGYARQFGWKESWTQNDVYITRSRDTELGWTRAFAFPDDYLLTYLDGEPTYQQNLVAWIKSSTHHTPLSEDFSTDWQEGVTLTHWHGFRIDPFNLFGHNPLGAPTQC